MAKNATESMSAPIDNDGWEDVAVGLGEEWDLEQDGPIQGIFAAMQTLDVPDTNRPGETRATNAYQIEVENSDNPNRFIWGSYNIDQAMKEIQIGDEIRITFLGVNSFKDAKTNVPKQVKTYRVQKRVRPQ